MLFLTDVGHGYCEKRQKQTRRYLQDTAISSKKGDFNTPSVFLFFKRNRRFEICYFKTAVLRRKVDHNGLVVCVSTDAIKRKEPIIRMPAGYGLSALRLCVWLFDNGYIELFYMDQGFLPTFRTEQREVFEFRIFPYL